MEIYQCLQWQCTIIRYFSKLKGDVYRNQFYSSRKYDPHALFLIKLSPSLSLPLSLSSFTLSFHDVLRSSLKRRDIASSNVRGSNFAKSKDSRITALLLVSFEDSVQKSARRNYQQTEKRMHNRYIKKKKSSGKRGKKKKREKLR